MLDMVLSGSLCELDVAELHERDRDACRVFVFPLSLEVGRNVLF
jgi:hypothetical protein